MTVNFTTTNYKGFEIEKLDAEGAYEGYIVYDEDGCPISQYFKTLAEAKAYIDLF